MSVPSEPLRKERNHATVAAITAATPFIAWIMLQAVSSWFSDPAFAYAVRAGICAALAGAFWQGAGDRRDLGLDVAAGWRRSLPVGLAAGLAVFVLWVAPETSGFYRRWLVWPPGALPDPVVISPYDPTLCGWVPTVFKIIGSAFVIAPIEEVFFRSFLYRALQARDFRSVSVSRFDLSAFVITVALFACEHDRWLAGALAGIVYGVLALRCGLGAAIVAHVVTNLVLAFYVVFGGHWGFW